MANGVTLKKIAARVGYSKNTVSLALRSDPQIPRRTRERIQKVADEMGYQRNAVVAHLMAQLRSNQSATRFQGKLALVHAGPQQNLSDATSGVAAYVSGCRNRANDLGYSFDNFWLHDPSMNASSWIRILTTRGIKGIVVVGLVDDNCLPARLSSVWQHFPTVVAGLRTREPALPFACVDHHQVVAAAFEKVLERGYRRPALVIADALDRLVERRFSAGMLAVQETLPEDQRIAPFFGIDGRKSGRWRFYEWFEKARPDVVLTPHEEVVEWLKDREVRSPGDVGIVQLDRSQEEGSISGMNQHRSTTGKAAVDMVVAQIHKNECGVPAFPLATLIGATWVEGSSIVGRAGAQPIEERSGELLVADR